MFSESPHLTLFKLMLDQKGVPQEKAYNHTCCRSLPLEMLQVEVIVQDQGQDQGKASEALTSGSKIHRAIKKCGNQDKQYFNVKVKNENKIMMSIYQIDTNKRVIC